MKHMKVFAVCLCLTFVLVQACSQAGQSNSAQPAQRSEPTPEPVKQDPDILIIRGVLANNDGSPAADRSVSMHPLDKKGKPLFVSIFEEKEGGMASPKAWNPTAKTDGDGRFALQVPRVEKIGDDLVKEVALAVDAKPEGGWVTGTISRLYYVNKNKKEDLCFVKDDSRIRLLQSDNQTLKVKIDQPGGEIDIGKVAVN